MDIEKPFDMIFKIILVGDSSVGKTNILSRYLNNTFEENTKPTVGVEFNSKTYNIDDNIVKAQIWDTAGQERYRSITSAYYKGAKGCLLIYDITRKKTFENIDKWISQFKEGADENLYIILIGNKCDLADARQVSKEEAEEKAKFYNMAFIETSALNGTNVEEAFETLINEVYQNNNSLYHKRVSLSLTERAINIEKEMIEEVNSIFETRASAGYMHIFNDIKELL